MQLLYNGAASEKFSPSNDIRQGDPFSWYILCIMHGRIYSFNYITSHIRKWIPVGLEKMGLAFHICFSLVIKYSVESVKSY